MTHRPNSKITMPSHLYSVSSNHPT